MHLHGESTVATTPRPCVALLDTACIVTCDLNCRRQSILALTAVLPLREDNGWVACHTLLSLPQGKYAPGANNGKTSDGTEGGGDPDQTPAARLRALARTDGFWGPLSDDERRFLILDRWSTLGCITCDNPGRSTALLQRRSCKSRRHMEQATHTSAAGNVCGQCTQAMHADNQRASGALSLTVQAKSPQPAFMLCKTELHCEW